MSLSRLHIASLLLALTAAFPAPSASQFFSESGMASGSGLSFLPSTALAPTAHWRVNYARVDYLRTGLIGMNIVGLEYALSTNLGGYVRVTGEQLGTLSSLSAIGLGVKALIPVRFPVVRAAAGWFEVTTSDDMMKSPSFPARATRGGLIAGLGDGFLQPILFAGVASVEGRVFPLAGAGLTASPGSAVQIGVEAIRGYAGEKSLHAALDLSVRVVPHVALIASQGYLSTSAVRTLTFSIGVAVSTADVDFRPSRAVAARDEFKLPSLEDIMKDSSEEKKQ